MSDTNTLIVRQVYDAFVRKDLPSILALQAEDSEWSVAASNQLIPWAGPFQGQDGVTQFLRTLSEWLIAERFRARLDASRLQGHAISSILRHCVCRVGLAGPPYSLTLPAGDGGPSIFHVSG